MESLEPLINLIVLLTVMSVAAERATNLLKLRHNDLRMRKSSKEEERAREYRISVRSFLVGLILAVLVKADFFEIMLHLDSPWRTLGWVQVHGYTWFRSAATSELGTIIYALAGCVITGAMLGFGSKFWHDILGSVYELRGMARNRRERGENRRERGEGRQR